MTAIDGVVAGMTDSDRDRFVVWVISDILKMSDRLQTRLEELLQRVGWGIRDTEPYPLELRVDLSVSELPDAARIGVERAIKRYRDGDPDEAIGAICGVIDSLTQIMYAANPNLGDHTSDGYQERVSKSMRTLETRIREQLVVSGMDVEEINRVWNNQKSAASNAAYVLAAFRRQYADVHGVKVAPKQFVQRAFDCATFIIKNLVN